MEEFVANNSRSKCALLLAFSLAIIFFTCWAFGLLGSEPGFGLQHSTFGLVVAWLATLVFGQLALRTSLRWWHDKNYLVIGYQGIRFVGWSDQLIPWSEIEGISEMSFRNYRMIILELRHPQRLKRNGLIGRLGWFDGLIARGRVDISLVGADRTLDDAMVAIQKFRANAQRRMQTNQAELPRAMQKE